MKKSTGLRHAWLCAALAGIAAIVAGCASSPMPAPPPPPPPPAPVVVLPPPPPPPPPAPAAVAAAAKTSGATSARDYRRDAAGHLYASHSAKIYKGKLPPLLYAIGVYEIEVDIRGQIISTHWLRAPTHAPEVMAEIDRLARSAAPYPLPVRLGRVTYTDTWLWDKSGFFQLDTLSEGQE